MPIHYGSRALNIHTVSWRSIQIIIYLLFRNSFLFQCVQVSSPLGTQIPQSVGVAYKKKLEYQSGKSKELNVSAVYFGDGAASTGDFYSACTFAATLKVPVRINKREFITWIWLIDSNHNLSFSFFLPRRRFCSFAAIMGTQSALLFMNNMPVMELFAERRVLEWQLSGLMGMISSLSMKLPKLLENMQWNTWNLYLLKLFRIAKLITVHLMILSATVLKKK